MPESHLGAAYACPPYFQSGIIFYFGEDQALLGIFVLDFVVVAKKSLPGLGSQIFSPVFF